MFDMDEKGINNQINDKKKRMIVEYTYNLIVTKITEEHWFIHHIYVISSTQKNQINHGKNIINTHIYACMVDISFINSSERLHVHAHNTSDICSRL